MWASYFVRNGNKLSISSWLTTEVQVCRNVGRPNPRPPKLVFFYFLQFLAELKFYVITTTTVIHFSTTALEPQPRFLKIPQPKKEPQSEFLRIPQPKQEPQSGFLEIPQPKQEPQSRFSVNSQPIHHYLRHYDINMSLVTKIRHLWHCI